MTFRIALTGGIASGKSTVASRFAQLGVVVIDTDILAREAVAPGSPGLAAITDVFGPDVLTEDGHLDRAAMRQSIFSDNDKKQALEEILHPRIRALLASRSRTAGGPYQIFEIPLFVETGSQTQVDRVLVVDCDTDEQIRRVMARDDVDKEHAHAIVSRQATREQRLAVADDVIKNDGDLHALSDAVYKLHQRYLAMAATQHIVSR
ncbi:MAG: dephospho-CoA kinase [Gammaproteobacteria bacterium]